MVATDFDMSWQQAAALTDFVRESRHTGAVRLSSHEGNVAGQVLLAELLGDGDRVVRDRLLHRFGTITP